MWVAMATWFVSAGSIAMAALTPAAPARQMAARAVPATGSNRTYSVPQVMAARVPRFGGR